MSEAEFRFERLRKAESRIERLEAALEEIARQSDSHKRSRLCVEGQNVALVNVRNIALFALGQQRDFAERTGEWAGWID
jgi:hypothetical protein